MITANQLRDVYYAKPFRPFELLFDDGQRVRIDDPIYISFSEEARTVAYPHGRHAIGHASFDRVLSIELVDTKGKRRQRKAS